jgi:hypothetical protein
MLRRALAWSAALGALGLGCVAALVGALDTRRVCVGVLEAMCDGPNWGEALVAFGLACVLLVVGIVLVVRGFDAEHRRGRVVRQCHRQGAAFGNRRCPVRGPPRVDRIESYWGSEMEAPAFPPENVAELGCSASAHRVSGSRSRRPRRADPVQAGPCWPKSSHCAGFSIVGSMLARQSQLEGIVAGGEPITIAISSPFFRTMVEIGWV